MVHWRATFLYIYTHAITFHFHVNQFRVNLKAISRSQCLCFNHLQPPQLGFFARAVGQTVGRVTRYVKAQGPASNEPTQLIQRKVSFWPKTAISRFISEANVRNLQKRN